MVQPSVDICNNVNLDPEMCLGRGEGVIQRILHQCYNWCILIFFVTKCVGNVDAFCIKLKFLVQNASTL